MQQYLDRPQNWFESKMGKYCTLFLRSTKNIDYDSLEFKFERKMIAVQYLLLDEQSEPRRYYNPSNKSIPFWKRPFNFDTMPSYDQLMEEAECRFYSYQYKYEGFQRIEPYSIFCPWKNTQREIDLVLDHIHFSLDVGEKKSLNRKGNITLDTLDSKVDPNIQIKPYQIFPSNNLVYEGLPHPAEQSLILSPDTSLIERAFQALIDICKESIPSSNDCSTRNNNSAPQLTVPEPSKPCRLLLVRESRTATELETNKKLWLHSQRRNIEVTVPMHPSERGTKSWLRKWLSTFVHQ
ncbi:CFA_G0046560.mRNA.1.CDS.1 [Saccharomyces cerevisiae]|nr:CFA_G0046560.mRNA.1.CDS.1 [Saccharomyces cerevisiae]CAI7446719.1 CFA_G0046560.mRNA.1.CDS.1 [Saccharomyces cerevisiae]